MSQSAGSSSRPEFGSSVPPPYAELMSGPTLVVTGDTQPAVDSSPSLFTAGQPPADAPMPIFESGPASAPKLGFQEILRQQVAQRRAQSPLLSGSQVQSPPDTQPGLTLDALPSLGLVPATPASPGAAAKMGFQEILRQQVAQRRAESPLFSGSQPSGNGSGSLVQSPPAPDAQTAWSTIVPQQPPMPPVPMPSLSDSNIFPYIGEPRPAIGAIPSGASNLGVYTTRTRDDPPSNQWGAALPPAIRPSPTGQGPAIDPQLNQPGMNPTNTLGNRVPDLNVGVGGSLWDNAIDPMLGLNGASVYHARSADNSNARNARSEDVSSIFRGPEQSGQLFTASEGSHVPPFDSVFGIDPGRRTAQANFKCPVPGCGATFTRHFNLRGHIRSHNEERPFKCKWPGCDKGFARQHDCKRHEALHLNIRPYTCEGCQKTFARMDALNRHLRSEGGIECQRVQSEITEQDMSDAPRDLGPVLVPEQGKAEHEQVSSLPSSPRSTHSSKVIQDDGSPSHPGDVPNASRHKYGAGEAAAQSLHTHCTVPLEQVVVEIESVPGIGDLVECLTLVFQTIERSRVNKDQWRLLRGRCVMVARIVVAQVIGHGQHHDLESERVMGVLRDTFNAITGQSQHYSQMEQGTEFFQFEAISEEIKRLFGTLDSCLTTLFPYEIDIARSQWTNEFRLVQEQELASLKSIRQAFLDKNKDLKRTTADQARPASGRSENLRSKGMSAREMFECLMRHGCRDLTKKVDVKTISEHAVATGAYGDIWKGKLDDSTDIAIKVWSFRRFDEAPQKCLKGAMRELYNWSKADHDNIQKLLGVIMFKDRLGMVSEWMDNGNLQDYLRQHEPVDRYQLSIQAAKAVQHLHREGMVHGDIKACNFLVSSDGVVKLTDFDHSIISCHSIVFSQTTTMGGGTMRWMAPELVMDEGEIELRSTQADVYALGMTILEIITGAPPYAECQSDPQVFCKLLQKALPERAEHLQNARGELLWRLLAECWDHDPAMRPSADHVVDQLQLLVHTTLPLSDDAQD